MESQRSVWFILEIDRGTKAGGYNLAVPRDPVISCHVWCFSCRYSQCTLAPNAHTGSIPAQKVPFAGPKEARRHITRTLCSDRHFNSLACCNSRKAEAQAETKFYWAWSSQVVWCFIPILPLSRINAQRQGTKAHSPSCSNGLIKHLPLGKGERAGYRSVVIIYDVKRPTCVVQSTRLQSIMCNRPNTPTLMKSIRGY